MAAPAGVALALVCPLPQECLGISVNSFLQPGCPRPECFGHDLGLLSSSCHCPPGYAKWTHLITEPNGTFTSELWRHHQWYCNHWSGDAGLHSLDKWPLEKMSPSLCQLQINHDQSQFSLHLELTGRGSLIADPLNRSQLSTAQGHQDPRR